MEASRHLAHLPPFSRFPLVFLTVVTYQRRPVLGGQSAFEILTEIWRSSASIDGWHVGDYLLMPDHVHLFAKGSREAKPLGKWVGSWKSLSSRRLKNAASLASPVWQADYFDRFLRSKESYREKWEYVASNPVRKGFCQNPQDWPWKGRLHEFDR